jgi:hypothetical protein
MHDFLRREPVAAPGFGLARVLLFKEMSAPCTWLKGS